MKQNDINTVVCAISSKYKLFNDDRGNSTLVDNHKGNTRVHIIGGKICNAIIRNAAKRLSLRCSNDDIKQINDIIAEEIEAKNESIKVYSQFLRTHATVTIDVCDKDINRIVLNNGQVRIQASNEDTNFIQQHYALPYILPSEMQCIDHISAFLNMNHADQLLLICWITFIICNPKTAGVSTPILCLIGGQGTGKSSLCRLLRQLIDPSELGIQKLPRTSEQLALMADNANILFFDNVRNLSSDISDSLCATSTGGKLSSRKLYTNSEEHLLSFKTAVVINGIHPFIAEPDLADRCITIHPKGIAAEERRTEADINAIFAEDAPFIIAGLLNLSAITLQKLGDAKTISPSRMLDFCHWIASVELALSEMNTDYSSVEVGEIQRYYAENQERLTLDNLLENELASAIVDMSNSDDMEFSGTPAQLLQRLNCDRPNRYLSAQQWPNNPIALSKRLTPLIPALAKLGIVVELTRGKKRKVTISLTEKHSNYHY
jgi:energy-coupling factor transporter ATP-binding protein EcfA2